ncbi:GAF and ANTAR domain-containing protein [Arthrobacter sp. PsM3]|uniref:GAF and ANTAR domain-containing protein n=1 Tax=Arthrobacter sp. PsM3 TaxID=3030531 RepID=UPI00263A880C|nr:GAF and ANTAR domain-containing protein [Arthrobacter sp. PsM3]MDN4643022.1 GAF and ANTAR domain-containing protein [Arthrobacter sp. PsM3]
MVPNSAEAGEQTRGPRDTAPISADALAVRLGDIARELQHKEDPESMLDGIVHAALELVPHAAEASVSLITGNRTIESRAASSDLPRRVDALQSDTGQGPCMEASYDERIVSVPDLSTDTRWPEFSRQAFRLGARSMLSFQLFVNGDHLGALNLFGKDAGVFDAESERIGALVAAHAAVAVAGSQQISQLTLALDTRDLIGQAKGILMERYKITAQQAFLLLSRASSELNIKLREVAEQLTVSGEMAKKR